MSRFKRLRKQNNTQFSDFEESEEITEKYVQAKRANKKKQQNKKTKKNKIKTESQDSQILQIYKGDSFHGEHTRPSFLKRWDGISNNLDLTEDDYDDMSPMMKVYWKFKSKNMNCIIFVQLGKIEFLAFQNDALKLSQIFKKPLRKFSKFIRCNFWSREIELAKMQLFERSMPVLMLNEIRDAEFQQENGIIKRQITEVITPSIYLDYESKKYRQRLMMCIFRQRIGCGIVCVDIQSNKFLVQQFNIDTEEQFHQIRRIVNKYRPVQAVVKTNDSEVKKILKQICNPYIIDLDLPLKLNLEDMIKEMKESSNSPFFKQMLTSYRDYAKKKKEAEKEKPFSYQLTSQTLYLIFSYLKNLQLQSKIFGQGLFEICSLEASKLKPMFDAQVYENLQIFNLKDEEEGINQKGTLYTYLNHCQTNAGQKLLKRWINEPLRTQDDILQRQKAISSLLEKKQVFQVGQRISAFKKLERKIGNIYHWVTKKNDGLILTKDLNFDKDYNEDKNPAVQRLKQIYSVLGQLQKVQNFFKQFQVFCGDSLFLKNVSKVVELPNLKQATLKKLKGQVPSIKSLIQEFQDRVQKTESRSIEPAQGEFEEFDKQKKAIKQITKDLDDILAGWRKKFDTPRVSYVSVRARNELQVPLNIANKKKYKQLIFSSQTSTFIRYVHPDVQELSQNLMKHEERLAKSYEPFLGQIVRQFCSYKQIWDIYINNISSIDVLLALAKVSSAMQPRCLPRFKSDALYINNGYHPGLLQVKNKQHITPNTLLMKENERILLLSGPNMGGKSTLLRQVCLLAIIAQLGCYVPAEQYQAPIFDQIFCRIGASDKIIEGKSTFYVQLEETKRITDQATPESLVIIDELGRGTSTYDGMALASSVLSFVSEEINCFTLFSTHYYPLIQDFKHFQSMKCAKMGYDFEGEDIKFTYGVQQGIAERSFANQVAKMVGISSDTVALAEEKSLQIQAREKLLRDLNDEEYKEIISFLGG